MHYEMLKDTCHDQYEEIQELKSKITKAIEYIKEEMYSEPKELYGLVPADEVLKILGDKE